MPIQLLPLTERLNRAYDGRAAYPEYDVYLLRTLAHIPMDVYFDGEDESLRRLVEILGGSLEAVGHTTYREIMLTIESLWKGRPDEATEILDLMTVPFVSYMKTIQERSLAPDEKNTP